MDVILLGEIQDLIEQTNSNIDTVKTTVDSINTNMAKSADLTTVKTNTNTNNTESSTGTLSQKLTYLINRRDRIVTPSNTVIKTLSSSLSATLAESESSSTKEEDATKTVYSGSSSTVYMKQNGVFRFSFSGTLSQQTDLPSKVSAWNIKESCSLVGYVYVYHISTGTTSTHTVKIISDLAATYNTTLATSTATKTIDIPIQNGDRVYCKVALVCTSRAVSACSYYNYSNCGWSASCTDCSVRGTAQEVNSITT